MRRAILLVAALVVVVSAALAQTPVQDSIQSVSGTSGNPDAGTASGWDRALDCNFVTAPAAVLVDSDAGTNTICGKTMRLQNLSHTLGSGVIIDGGLIMTPDAISVYAGSGDVYSTCYVYVYLSDIIPHYTADVAVRATVYVTSNQEAANFDATVFSLNAVTAVSNLSTPGQMAFHWFKSFNSSLSLFPSMSHNADARTDWTGTPVSGPTTTNVWTIEIPQGFVSPRALWKTAVYSSGIPSSDAQTTFTVGGWAPSGAQFDSASSANPLNTQGQVNMGCERDGTNASQYCVFGELIVDYFYLKK